MQLRTADRNAARSDFLNPPAQHTFSSCSNTPKHIPSKVKAEREGKQGRKEGRKEARKIESQKPESMSTSFCQCTHVTKHSDHVLHSGTHDTSSQARHWCPPKPSKARGFSHRATALLMTPHLRLALGLTTLCQPAGPHAPVLFAHHPPLKPGTPHVAIPSARHLHSRKITPPNTSPPPVLPQFLFFVYLPKLFAPRSSTPSRWKQATQVQSFYTQGGTEQLTGFVYIGGKANTLLQVTDVCVRGSCC